jgi:AraC-like DNA-binding protein
MPNMDGVKFLAELKNNRYTNHIPVIFLSSKTKVEDQISGFEHGLETYITKPFNPKHLVAVVNHIFENRKSLKDYYSSSISSLEEYNGHQMLADDKDLLLKINKIVELNIENEQLNPDFVIREMGISRMQLYRKLKELCDLSPSEFIRRVKLQHATKLLKSTKLTVQEVMYQSGFNNRSYFYREFQKDYGISPREFRK